MTTMRLLKFAGLSLAVACVPLAGAVSMTSDDDAPSGSSQSTDDGQAALAYAEAQAAIEAGQYQAAIDPLLQIVGTDPGNADAYNLLGYASRSLEQYNDAMAYYEKALALDPEHLGANEYYGELMLTLGNLSAAEERLAVLDEVCYLGCDEYDALEAAIDAYMTAE